MGDFKSEGKLYGYSYTLKINNNILVTRDFNVSGVNEKFRESCEMNDVMTLIMGDGSPRCNGFTGIIPSIIKNNSMKHMWDCYDGNGKLYELNIPNAKTTTFTFELNKRLNSAKHDDLYETMVSAVFIADQYQPMVLKKNDNYRIDLKGVLPKITSLLQDYMSMKTSSYTKEFNGVELKRFNKYSDKQLKRMRGE